MPSRRNVKIKSRWIYHYRAVDSDGKIADFLLRAKLLAAAKAFFQRAFKGQGRLPRAITLDGYQASHRVGREFFAEHQVARGRSRDLLIAYCFNNFGEIIDLSSSVWTQCSVPRNFVTRQSQSLASSSCIGFGKVGSHWGKLRRADKIAPETWAAVLAA